MTEAIRAAKNIHLRCRSESVGEAAYATGHLRVRCRGKFCRREGFVTFHVFDLATGLYETYYEPYQHPRVLLGEQRSNT